LNKLQQVKSVLKHIEVRPVPYSLLFLKDAENKIKKYYKLDKNQDLYNFIGNYIVEICTDIHNFAEMDKGSNFYKDIYDVTWRRDRDNLTRGAVYKFPIDEPNLDNYKHPEFDNKCYYENLKIEVKENKNKFLLVWVDGIFERSGFLRGFENLLIDFHNHSSFVEELFSKQLECNLIQVENICKYKIDGIFISDDIAYQEGLIMRPKIWRKFIKPKMGKLVSLIHNKGKYAFYHSDGKIDEIVPDLVDIGMDAINPVQSEVMDYKRLKREYGKNISFYGGLSHQKVLAFGETKDVINEIREKIEILSKNGGYIAGTGLTPPPGIPLENLIALIENLKEQVHT